MRKPVMTKVRLNMQVNVLSIGLDAGALKISASIKPELSGLTHGRCLARRYMRAFAHIDRDFGLARVGILLAGGSR